MRQLLESIIRDWWAKPLPPLLPRRIDLSSFANLPIRKAICVTGFRRTGKTYLLFDLAYKLDKSRTIYINFEDERLPHQTNTLTSLLEILEELRPSLPITLLLDEIQNIPNWSVWARRVLDTTPHQLFISGSSSKVSSNELPTEMRGRSLSIQVSPLDFQEFSSFKKLAPGPSLARQYLTYGGFPEVALVDEGKKPLLIDEYFQTFILRDLVERYKIRHTDNLKLLIRLLLNSPYFTISKLANSIRSQGIDISKPTVARFISHLTQSYFLHPLQLHTPNIKNRLKAAQKTYFVDSGFVSRLSTTFSQNLGFLLEHTIRTSLQATASEVYYWQDYAKHEVDFVVRRQESVTGLIQSCYISTGDPLPDREISSLMKAAKALHCSDLTIVTWDLEKQLETSGYHISLVPLYRWLNLI